MKAVEAVPSVSDVSARRAIDALRARGGMPEKRYRVEFDIQHCEGNFNCVGVDVTHFMALPGGNKSDLLGGTMERGLKVLDVDASELDDAIEAAKVCPPQVIRVRDLETGELLGGPDVLPHEKGGPAQTP